MAAPRRNYTVIGDTWLNIRERPTKESPVIGRFEVGDKVTVNPSVETPLGWFAVKDGGYVMGAYLE